jgi:glutamyl-tRNA synthetase
MIKKEIRVRFAPSPTGFLHVGGARTAIFNWLFARNQKGKFLVRIEDTDPQRSRSEMTEQIIKSLEWLGMESDEPLAYQSDGIQRYRDVIEKLISEKKAYYCFESEEELSEKRKQSQLKKIPYKYDRAALQMSDQRTAEALQKNLPRTVRFLVPLGETRFHDLIHGETVFQNSEIDDFVLLRSDGSPVYQIAVVVDDYDMKISHVIRGDDHLSNTPKQILLYKAMNWDLPEFAHLPMILDEQKKKLSKRRNPVAVEEYRDKGYLPDALFNFLTLLGFAPEGNKEIISREELVKMFTLERVNRKSAVFDTKKLNWVNSEYIRLTDENRLAEMLIQKGINKDKDYLIRVIKLMKERVNTINDFIEFGRYFFEDPVSYDDKGLEKYWDDEAKNLLREYLAVLDSGGAHSPLSQKDEEKRLRDFAEKKGVKAASIIHPMRLALTGHTVSPGIFEVMELLGRETVIRRLRNFTA